MKTSCIICNREIDTKNEDTVVTVSWIYNDLIKKNNVQLKKDIPQIVKTCIKCWNNVLKVKPNKDDYYWMFNKSI